MKLLVPTLLLLMLFNALEAHAAADERGELLRQRRAVESRYQAESQACQQRFLVNDCVQTARLERNAALRPLDQRLQQLDVQERQQRAREHDQRVADRQREFAAEEGRRRTEALRQPPSAADGRPAETLPARSLPVDPEIHARAITRQADDAAAAAAREREQASRRQRLVLQHQQDAQRRQAEREAKQQSSGRPPAKPLPLPSAAEIAATAASAASR
ncbi:hypothetical protein [Pelomonas sp. KK5]|uniref:hypothetical protein n=1 Tax=Pelomonas sp. KK5 TaxID=1855730 RepID=UPI00117F1E81|nr:hypothetical protein [Pelomonas sp. KK5]